MFARCMLFLVIFALLNGSSRSLSYYDYNGDYEYINLKRLLEEVEQSSPTTTTSTTTTTTTTTTTPTPTTTLGAFAVTTTQHPIIPRRTTDLLFGYSRDNRTEFRHRDRPDGTSKSYYTDHDRRFVGEQPINQSSPIEVFSWQHNGTINTSTNSTKSTTPESTIPTTTEENNNTYIKGSHNWDYGWYKGHESRSTTTKRYRWLRIQPTYKYATTPRGTVRSYSNNGDYEYKWFVGEKSKPSTTERWWHHMQPRITTTTPRPTGTVRSYSNNYGDNERKWFVGEKSKPSTTERWWHYMQPRTTRTTPTGSTLLNYNEWLNGLVSKSITTERPEYTTTTRTIDVEPGNGWKIFNNNFTIFVTSGMIALVLVCIGLLWRFKCLCTNRSDSVPATV